MMSSPPIPRIVSRPPKPQITSAPGGPFKVSGPSEPRITLNGPAYPLGAAQEGDGAAPAELPDAAVSAPATRNRTPRPDTWWVRIRGEVRAVMAPPWLAMV